MSIRTWLLILPLALGVTYLEIVAVTGAWRLTAKPAVAEKLGKGKVYVLKNVVAIETEAADGLTDKCLLEQGDRIRIVQIEHVGTSGHAVTVSYEPIARAYREDFRCAAGTLVALTEMTVEQLVVAQ